MNTFSLITNWIEGIAFFIAFLLTFWPSHNRMTIAAKLWTIGMLSTGILFACVILKPLFATITLVNISATFSFVFSPPILLSLISLVLVITESTLLFRFSQERALRLGKVLFLFIVPVFMLLKDFLLMPLGHIYFPLGVSYIGYALLWLRIRENLTFEIAEECLGKVLDRVAIDQRAFNPRFYPKISHRFTFSRVMASSNRPRVIDC